MSNIASTTKLAIKRSVTAVILILGIISSQASASEAQSDLKNGKVSADRAAELTHMLRHDCGSCHGMTLKGGLGPSLLPEQFTDKNADYIKLTILHGRNGTAMPPWKAIISEQDAQWMAEFLLSGKIKQFNQ